MFRTVATLVFLISFMLITVITFCNLLNPTPPQAEKYRRRISGPQLDQIDVHVEVPLVDYRDPASMKESV